MNKRERSRKTYKYLIKEKQIKDKKKLKIVE